MCFPLVVLDQMSAAATVYALLHVNITHLSGVMMSRTDSSVSAIDGESTASVVKRIAGMLTNIRPACVMFVLAFVAVRVYVGVTTGIVDVTGLR